MKRIAVTGGRDYTNADRVSAILRSVDRVVPGEITLVHGNAQGADTMARNVAIALGWKHESWVPQWDEYGKAAGPIRNRNMLSSGIDLLIAFPGGRGTQGCVEIAHEMKLHVMEVND